MEKFRRNYELEIQIQTGEVLHIRPPFTVEFDIVRNIFSSANQATFRVLNLSKVNRDLLRHDQFDYADLKRLRFRAGYGDNISTAFSGTLSQAFSVRERVNFITQMAAIDGGFAFSNGRFSDQFPSSTRQNVIIDALISSLSVFGVERGVVGTYTGETGRGNSYTGNTTDRLRELTGGGFFIDNGKVNCLNDDECFAGDIVLINNETGLLNTPRLEQTNLTFDMIFEPRLLIGQKIELRTATAAQFNGFYKVISIKHRGVISDAVCGDAVTTVGLYYGPSTLREVSS